MQPGVMENQCQTATGLHLGQADGFFSDCLMLPDWMQMGHTYDDPTAGYLDPSTSDLAAAWLASSSESPATPTNSFVTGYNSISGCFFSAPDTPGNYAADELFGPTPPGIVNSTIASGAPAVSAAVASNLDTVIWAAGLYTEATSLQPSKLLFPVMADLSRELAARLPTRMLVRDYRFRSDVPIVKLQGKPIIMRLPRHVTNTQRKVLDRLLNAKMAVIVPLPDCQFVLSPERIKDQIVIIGALADSPAP